MPTLLPDCPGSWRPVAGALPGDRVRCEVCGKEVPATVPPVNLSFDPWPGSRSARVQAHWPLGTSPTRA